MMSIGKFLRWLLRWLTSYKRPLFAMVVVGVTLGSVVLYTSFIQSLPPLPRAENLLEVATGKFDVEITLTFDAKPDTAFVLEPTSVLLTLEGKTLLQATEPFRAGRPVLVENVSNVKVGENEFTVAVYAGDAARHSFDSQDAEPDPFSIGSEADEDADDFAVTRAVRIRILRDGEAIAEETLWSDPGKQVEGQVSVTVPPAVTDEHGHDH